MRLFSWAVERSTRRPLSTVERDRPKWPGKWCPMKSGSALSRSRLGCGVVARPFSGREVGDFSRSQAKRGRCVWSDVLLRGLLKIPRGLRDHAAERPTGATPVPTRLRGRDGAGCGPESAPGRRTPKSKWPRVFRLAGHSGRVAGGLAATSEADFLGKIEARGAFLAPKAPK